MDIAALVLNAASLVALLFGAPALHLALEWSARDCAAFCVLFWVGAIATSVLALSTGTSSPAARAAVAGMLGANCLCAASAWGLVLRAARKPLPPDSPVSLQELQRAAAAKLRASFVHVRGQKYLHVRQTREAALAAAGLAVTRNSVVVENHLRLYLNNLQPRDGSGPAAFSLRNTSCLCRDEFNIEFVPQYDALAVDSHLAMLLAMRYCSKSFRSTYVSHRRHSNTLLQQLQVHALLKQLFKWYDGLRPSEQLIVLPHHPEMELIVNLMYLEVGTRFPEWMDGNTQNVFRDWLNRAFLRNGLYVDRTGSVSLYANLFALLSCTRSSIELDDIWCALRAHECWSDACNGHATPFNAALACHVAVSKQHVLPPGRTREAQAAALETNREFVRKLVQACAAHMPAASPCVAAAMCAIGALKS